MSQSGSLSGINSIIPPTVATIYGANSGSATPAANVIYIFGGTISAGTTPIATAASGDILTVNAQISQAIAATDATKVGLSAFDSSSFAVDSSGFVTFIGTPVPKGALGTVLQGQGLLVTPAYSTATYPSTAGSSGNVLTSDGTNWISSTPASTSISITGNSGGAQTSTSFTFTGSTTGLTFAGAANTFTLGGTLIVANGGTGQTTLTNHGVLVGAGTTAISQLAAGSAGQILQSGGGAANPAYSTATYPAIATGTSQILVADGTNWVASTPTFPNASATSRKIIVSDGTNWVASTETWATPSTSGNVLTSDGTNWTSAAAPGAGILVATGTLTNAQIKALHGTPVQVIAAPGSGKVIQLICGMATLNYGGTNAFTAGASQSIACYFNGASSATCVIMTNTILTSTTSQVSWCTITASGTGNDLTFISNKNLTLFNNIATEITGNAANNNTISYNILYRIATIP